MKFVSGALALASAVAVAFAAVPTGQVSAQTSASGHSLDDVSARFGIRENVLDISLSPSGNKIAFVSAGPEHTELVKVVNLAGDAQIRTVTGNDDERVDITQCEWATETRLVCRAYGVTENQFGTLLGFTRMFAVNDDGSDFRQLTEQRRGRALEFSQDGGSIVALDVPGEEGRILMTREYEEEYSTGTRIANTKEGLGVDSVNVMNARRTSVEDPDQEAVRYVADENGNVRVKIMQLADDRGNLQGATKYMYRPLGDTFWTELTDITIDGSPVSRFSPVAVDGRKNAAYGFITRNGYSALAEVALDGSSAGRTLLARDDVDVDGLIRIGRQRRVVGASYATEKREVIYFDEEIKALAQGLSSALPDAPLINIVGASADENKLLIVASSDTQPGMVYLFDKTQRSLEPILSVRDYLDNQPMGSMTPVTYTATDGTQIPGYLTLPPGSEGKNLPAVVMPHGGPAARDFWGFDWLVQFFTARGYAVLQPNYRGSSGYGEAWFGRNGYQAWDVAIGDVNDAGRWLVSEGIADPDKLVIAGWSYGGYAALQSQVVDPGLFKAVVAIAPVTDLEYLREDARAYVNFRLRDQQLGRGPHIDAGSPRQHAAGFTAPVALFHGELDLNVNVRHSRAMERALQDAGKTVSYTEFESLRHSLRDSRARTEMLAEIDRFLSASLER